MRVSRGPLVAVGTFVVGAINTKMPEGMAVITNSLNGPRWCLEGQLK